MKTRFSTLDIKAIVKELQRFLGMRVANVYDIDSRTYMIRVAKPDQKSVILIESGNRLHSTEFDWPKNPAPSGFSMKLRKHLRGRRLEVIQQFGIDRVVDLQFGSGEAAYHLVVELYDRGNLVLTDSEYTILNILRPRTDDSQDVRFAVRETYPIHTTKQFETISQERIKNLLHAAKEGDNLKRVLMPNLEFGPALLEHCLREAGLTDGGKIGKTFNIDTDFDTLYSALLQGETILKNLNSSSSKGYIIQKSEKRPSAADGESPVLLSYDEFHPFLFKQHADRPYVEFELFDKAVDEYFSKLEGQKLDLKALQQEKSALKKLDNVRRDHEKRVGDLRKEQEVDFLKGQLVEMNLELVDRAILVVRSALANQIDWAEINELVKEAQGQDDPVAAAIKSLRLDLNSISLLLRDPYTGEDLDEEDLIQPMKVDIDLGLSAYANSRKYFEKKKKAVVKEQKTVDSSTKAFKSAEKKTQQTLKDMATAVSINKTRKTYWFEKFLWFISSENFLVIGGRDQQQNELIVKRYLRPGDVYVHADLHGASSVIIKNTTGLPVPPKTLNEAGTMAICNSAAWDAKVVTSAWWVNPEQVSKTAPSGEYLTTGSFMIRGKKNYLPPSYLVYGFGFLFKLEDGSISRHHGERRVRTVDGDDTDSVAGSVSTETEVAVDDLSEGEGEETTGDPDNSREATRTDGGSPAGEGTDGNGDSLTSVKTEDDNGQAGDGQSTVAVGGDSGEFEDREVKTEAADDVSAEGGDDQMDNAFPDTSISLHHVQGDRFTLQPQLSQTDSVEDGESALSEKAEVKKQGAKLSAKQRREMKKGRKGGAPHALEEDQQTDAGQKEERTSVCEEIGEDSTKTSSKPLPQAQPKRGQKGKQKKIRDKYGDQDEEERQLRMEILASAGAQKEVKNKKKKKGKAPVEKVQVHNVQQQQDVRKHLQSLAAVDGAPPEGNNESVKAVRTKPATTQEDEDSGSEDEKGDKDERPVVEDGQILDSLTGRPVPDDELLFAIPVCAPYQAINTYKFKVKLLPGSSKKGKATKTALGIFLHDRETRAREKDLIRIMKDVDLSRNIPGKVKVLAPNLTKQRKK